MSTQRELASERPMARVSPAYWGCCLIEKQSLCPGPVFLQSHHTILSLRAIIGKFNFDEKFNLVVSFFPWNILS